MIEKGLFPLFPDWVQNVFDMDLEWHRAFRDDTDLLETRRMRDCVLTLLIGKMRFISTNASSDAIIYCYK